MWKTALVVALLGLGGCASGREAAVEVSAPAEAPAYIFAEIAVDDFEQYFPEYALPLSALLPQFEGEILAATRDGVAREGEKPGNWTVLAKFPSMAHAQAFYDSEEYAPLRSKRLNELTSDNLLIMIPTAAASAE